MALNLKLDKEYFIRSDSMNVMLCRVGNNREKIEGYFSTLPHAIESYLQLKIKLSDAQTIQSLLEELNALQHALNTALLPLQLKLVNFKEVEK